MKINRHKRELKIASAIKLSLKGQTYEVIASILNMSKTFVGKIERIFQ